MSRLRLRTMRLRARLAATLVATSLVTLAATVLIAAPALEHRLEHDRVQELRTLALTARPAFRAKTPADASPDRRDLHELVVRLRRRTGGRIAVYDAAGRALADTDPGELSVPRGVLRRDRAAAEARRDELISGVRGNRAFVVGLVRSGDARLTLLLAKPLDDTRAADAVLRSALPLVLLIGLGVAVVLALLASAGLLRRLARLRSDAQALGAVGLEHPVAVAGDDEVAQVAAALDDMRVRLLEEETSRRAFLATASHELRTPLASLQGTLELLAEQAAAPGADPAAILARTDLAMRQTHRLNALATDLLDLSRVDGGAPVHVEPLELGELATGIAQELAERLAHEERTLTVTGGPLHAVADAMATARILRILLDNACAYGRGAVEVTLSADGERALIGVRDHGPGVPDAERDRIFVRFARGRAAAGRPGAGLGLAIARGLAGAMDGAVESRPAASGACFVLTLPCWRQAAGNERLSASTRRSASRTRQTGSEPLRTAPTMARTDASSSAASPGT